MAKAKLNERGAHAFWHEVAAIFVLAFSMLLLLSLVSFRASDVGFLHTPASINKDNWVGIGGAYAAGILFLIFGWAAYFFPVILLGTAVLLALKPSFHIGSKVGWTLLLVVSGAALFQLAQPIFGKSLLNPIQSEHSPANMLGGLIGYWLNDKILEKLLGSVGAAVIMGVTHVASFIFLFEIRPKDLLLEGWRLVSEWQQEREAVKLESADPGERIVYQKKALEREHRALLRKLAKEGIEEDEVEDEDEEEEEEKPIERPKPKVIDTTVAVAKAKPSKTEAPAAVKPSIEAPVPSYLDYHYPQIDLLLSSKGNDVKVVSEGELRAQQQVLVDTLGQFGIEVSPSDITKGATITRYEVFPAPGVRVERIVSLKKDLARAMKAERIHILAPIPGKDTVGIEVPNNRKTPIVLRDLFESEDWVRSKGRLPVAIGKDVYGKVIIDDLADMPHLLIAGSTGSGKSVCINCLLLSLLYRFSPANLRLILIDPKVVELQPYNTLPHLVVPIVTDPKKVLLALRWVINEMEKRYRIMAKAGVRNIVDYNKRSSQGRSQLHLGGEFGSGAKVDSKADDDLPLPDHLPFIVVVVDELADLMQTAPADVENAIARLSAKARAAGIHLIIATQTPRAQVITGVIKTNVPARIAFQVPSSLDSRVILDENGAENLLGKGDLLFLRPGSSKLLRAQGAFVSEEEVSKVVSFISKQGEPSYETEIHEKISRSGSSEEAFSEKDTELLEKCLEIVRQEKRASTSLLQRRLKIGYGRAAWVMDQFEARGIVGPRDGAKDREILKDLDNLTWDETA